MKSVNRKIRLLISYDGTDFSGWQKQPEDRSVQEEIESALAEIHGCPVGITGSGRTDAGVHATGQVAHFESDRDSIPPDRFREALNRLLPPDISILESREAEADFHARYSARLREYRYYIASGDPVPAHMRRYCFYSRRIPDIRRLNRLAEPLSGRQDFTVFTAAGDTSKTCVRDIRSAVFFPRDGRLVFRITANAFLWKMVRSIVGTLLEMENEGRDREDMIKLIGSKDRNLAGRTAPAYGLFLHRVYYDG
jgi:tRNA pseudouridine38-40 synthase